MNYVVQNHYSLNWNILLTSRLKLAILLENYSTFLIFTKLNLHYSISKQLLIPQTNLFYRLFSLFFRNQFNYYFLLLNHKNPSNYLSYKSNYLNSLIYLNLLYLNSYVAKGPTQLTYLTTYSTFLFSNYFFSTMFTRLQITKKYYLQSTMFTFMFLSQFWFCYSDFFKFYLNLIYITNDYYCYFDLYYYFLRVLNK